MSNYLNTTIIEAMDRESRRDYYQSLCLQLGNISVYIAQVREVMERQGDFYGE